MVRFSSPDFPVSLYVLAITRVAADQSVLDTINPEGSTGKAHFEGKQGGVACGVSRAGGDFHLKVANVRRVPSAELSRRHG